MGLMLAAGKGLSQAALQCCSSMATCPKLTPDKVMEQIYKRAKKGLTPSQISVSLRGSHGVAQVCFVTGNRILRILTSKGFVPHLPEDLYHLSKKRVTIGKHLERNSKDTDAKFHQTLIGRQILRLVHYYMIKKVLSAKWKYESFTAYTLLL